MELLKIEMEDFRQFYGKQEVVFATGERNITTILGENGCGKTGIFRAMRFCIFGDEELEQDLELDSNGNYKRKSPKDKVHIVNINRMTENIGKAVCATVKTSFRHNNQTYIVTRKLYALKKDDGCIEKATENEVELIIIDKNGNVSPDVIRDHSKVQQVITNILNDKVKDFFFFNGDKIEKMATTNSFTRKEIKDGIMKLLNIDKVSRTIEILDKIIAEQRKKVNKLSKDSRLPIVESELEKFQNSKKSKKIELDLEKENERKLKKEIEDYTSELAENEELAELFRQKELKILEKNDKIKELYSLNEECKKLLKSHSHSLFIEDYVINSKKFLDQEISDNSYSIGITNEYIDRILNSGVCICNMNFRHGDEVYTTIKALKEKNMHSELSSFIVQFKTRISDFLELRDEYIEDIKKKLQNIHIIETQIEYGH